jgi:hypothetical protein
MIDQTVITYYAIVMTLNVLNIVFWIWYDRTTGGLTDGEFTIGTLLLCIAFFALGWVPILGLIIVIMTTFAAIGTAYDENLLRFKDFIHMPIVRKREPKNPD